ncbi:hypothetical protein DMB66_59605 [Actinoplanes sp. ATCC 53533]|nr:hypothetical protein DMB66_59605 [Actinoplanes sp. ATCC 53533]
MDAVVVNGQGELTPLPYHKAGLWSRSYLEPTGAADNGEADPGSNEETEVPPTSGHDGVTDTSGDLRDGETDGPGSRPSATGESRSNSTPSQPEHPSDTNDNADVRLSGDHASRPAGSDDEAGDLPSFSGRPGSNGGQEHAPHDLGLRPEFSGADPGEGQVPGSQGTDRSTDRGVGHGGDSPDGASEQRSANPPQIPASEMVAEDFDPQEAERRQLEALDGKDRAIIEASVDKAMEDASRLRVTLDDVVRSLNAAGEGTAQLVGVEHSYKTKTSLARAFAAEFEAEGTSPIKFLKDTKDRVRFSVQLREQDYHVHVAAAVADLQSRGHEIKKIVNFWGGERHNGLNVTIADPEGIIFELQFPTELSRSISDLTHELYEVLRHNFAPYPARMDAFLRIFAINIREGIAERQPDGVDELKQLGLAEWKDADSTFRKWIQSTTVQWNKYLADIHAEGSTFDRILARNGLTQADVLESNGSDGDDRHGLRLSGNPEVRHVGRSDQPDRLRGAELPLAPSGDVERAEESVDLRASGGGDIPVRSELSGKDPATRPRGGGTGRSGDPAVGVADGTDSSGDARGGSEDGLGLRPATRVAGEPPAPGSPAGSAPQASDPARRKDDTGPAPELGPEHDRSDVRLTGIPGVDGLALGDDGSDGRGRDEGDIRIPRAADGGRSAASEPDRHVDRDGPDLDLRARSSSAEALRRSIPRDSSASGSGDRGEDGKDGAQHRPAGRDDVGRPDDGRGTGERAPALPPAERRDPAGDDQRGSADGLGLRPAGPGPIAASGDVDPRELAAAQQAVTHHITPYSPELADVVVRLLTDHAATDHRLNATEALLDPGRRQRTLELLVELARTAVISQYGSLSDFLVDNPGGGSLFDPVSDDINTTPDGASRMKVFEAAARLRDPARAVGPNPTPAELTLLDDYGIRLRRRVLPAAKREIAALAELLGGQALVSARAKKVDHLFNKVKRMTSDRPNRPARPDYRIGDVIDAVGVRLTVPDMATLEMALGMVKERFGDRILEIENMYAQPKAQAPSYRVIPIIISIETDGLPCTYELQLTTQRASIAADIEHNTIYKPYISIDEVEEAAVKDAMREAAALDQLESIEQDDDGR